MQVSTSAQSLPILPRGRGLVLRLIRRAVGRPGCPYRPAAAPARGPALEQRRRRRLTVRRFRRRFHSWRWLVGQLPRLLARMSLLAVLLFTSGWPAVTRPSSGIVLLPIGPLLLTAGLLTQPARPGRSQWVCWLARLQRLYQLTLGLLLLSSLLRLVGHPLSALAGGALPLGGSEWVPSAEADTDIRVTTQGEQHFEVTLRGTFQLIWEPRDGFEKWLLVCLYAAATAWARPSPGSRRPRWPRPSARRPRTSVAGNGWWPRTAGLCSRIAFGMRSPAGCPTRR